MPSGLLLFCHCAFLFFHWEWGKPCNNAGLLMESWRWRCSLSHSKKPRLWVTTVWHISTCCFVATWTL